MNNNIIPAEFWDNVLDTNSVMFYVTNVDCVTMWRYKEPQINQ